MEAEDLRLVLSRVAKRGAGHMTPAAISARRFAWLCVVAGILTSCAPTLAKLPPPETLAELACDGRARAEAKQAPGALSAHFAKATPGEVAVGSLQALANFPVAAAMLVAAPVWYPIAKTKHNQRLYDDALARCVEAGAAAAEWDWP
jgi:hypothetical protein